MKTRSAALRQRMESSTPLGNDDIKQVSKFFRPQDVVQFCHENSLATVLEEAFVVKPTLDEIDRALCVANRHGLSDATALRLIRSFDTNFDHGYNPPQFNSSPLFDPVRSVFSVFDGEIREWRGLPSPSNPYPTKRPELVHYASNRRTAIVLRSKFPLQSELAIRNHGIVVFVFLQPVLRVICTHYEKGAAELDVDSLDAIWCSRFFIQVRFSGESFKNCAFNPELADILGYNRIKRVAA